MTQLGKLIILKTYEKTRKRTDSACGVRKIIWHTVQCSCGSKAFDLSHWSFTRGSQSCHSCSHSGKNNSKWVHGESRSTPEYRTWKSIKGRCYNPNYRQYQDYGGRGIKMCGRWLEHFEYFLSDMGRKPTPSHSINRIDNDKDYSPDNCEWADDKKQRRNKRTSVTVDINGESKNISDWLILLNIPKGTYYWRKKHGYTTLEALGVSPCVVKA